MSRRNTDPDTRKLRKLRKQLRNTPKRYFDLIDWLKLHRYAQTTGEARQIILDGRVRVESHTIGINNDIPNFPRVERHWPVELKSMIQVSD